MAEGGISPIASSSMDGVLIPTFVNETLHGNYNVYLDRQDIVNIARIEYGWRSEDTNLFQVIGDLESEKGQLENHLHRLRKEEIHSVTLVISLNHSHWVALVITNRRNNSFRRNHLAYYADSKDNTMPQLIKDILTGVDIAILSTLQEDSNGCNSGLFGLENARVINEALKKGSPVDLSKIPNGKDDLKLRRSQIALKIACNNWSLNAVREIRCQSLPNANDSEKSSKQNAKSINLPKTDRESKKLSYTKRSGTSGISGQLYETRLSMLVLKRGLKSDKVIKFHLGTNIAGIGVFDDLILSCHYNDNRHRVIFVQAKHRDDPERNKITLDNFRKQNGDISFDKCFDSYLKIRQKFNSSSDDEVFKFDFQNIDCDMVIFTSGIEDFGSNSFAEEIDTREDDLLQTSSISGRGKIFQFNCDEKSIIDEVVKSASISRMKQLAQSLAKLIFSSKNNCSNMMSDEFWITYHVILARKVIKVAGQDKGDYREGTILPEFYENKESLVAELRDALYKEVVTQYVNPKLKPSERKVLIEETIKKPSNENVSKLLGSILIYDAESNKLKIRQVKEVKDSKAKSPEIDDLKKILQTITDDIVKEAIAIAAKKMLESAKFRLHNTFGNLDFKVKGEKRLKHVTGKLVELVTNSEIMDNKMVVKINGPTQSLTDGDFAINGGIGGLVGNLLVLDDETKMLKFTNDRDILPENAKKLLSMLQKDLSEDQLNNSRFHISVNGFPLLSLECEESLIKDFLKKLKIYTNQPKEDKVESILKKEISSDYRPSDKKGTLPYRIKTDAICLKVHDEIQKWWKLSEGFYLTETCEFFNKAHKSIIDSPLLGVLDFLYLNRIKQYNIKFNSSAIHDLGLGNFSAPPDVQFLTITTAEMELSAIKLIQYCEKALIGTTFLDLDYVLARDCYREAIEELKTEKTLFIVVWENKKYLKEFSAEIDNILDILKTRKAILLIGNSVYEEVKGNLPKESTVKIDCKINFVHLALKSQEKLLKEKEIIFQEKKVKLGQLIGNDSKGLVLGNTLSKLLRNEPVKVGKMPMIDTDPYYIERRFFREIKDFFCSLKPVDIFCVNNDRMVRALESANLNGRILMKFEHTHLPEKQPENFIMILEESWEFKDLCQIYPNHNILFLEYCGNELITKNSHGDTSNFKDARERFENEASLENEFRDMFISNEIKNKVAVISAEPGMGKSSILTNMTKYIKDNYSLMWLVRINLNDFTRDLRDYNFADGLNSAIGFLSKIIGLETDLEKGIFKHCIKERGKIILFFDGFDEISPNYEAVVMKLLKTLENSKVEKIIVTTRPYHFESDLEEELSALKICLLGFDREGQAGFFTKFWEASLGIQISNDYRAHTFANWLTKRFESSINDNYSDIPFLSNPLHCMLIADYYKQNFKEFYVSGADGVSNEQEGQLNMNLSSFYREFVERKYFLVYCKDKKKKDLSNVDVSREEERSLYPEFLREHRLLALLTVLVEWNFNKILFESEKQTAFRLLDEFQRGEGKAGMIDKIVDGKPQFVHRTFAEYFVGCYFWEKYKSIEFNRFEEFIRSDIVGCFEQANMKQTCSFFEMEAQRDLNDPSNVLHWKEKLELLLSGRLFRFYQTSKLTSDTLICWNEIHRMNRFLSKLIDFHYDESMIIQKHEKLETKEKLELLRVYCQMGLIRFIRALTEGINQQDLMDDLKKGYWFDSPLWRATLYGGIDIVKFLKEKINYSPTWTDSNGTILLECILNMKNDLDMYFCIVNKAIEVARPHREWYHEKCDMKLVDFIENAKHTGLNYFLENVDIDFLNDCKLGHVSNVLLFSSRLYKDPILLRNLINRRMDVNGGGEDKLKPIHIVAYQFSPSILSGFLRSFYTEISKSIEMLLQNGAIYNIKDEFGKTVLDYVTQAYKISLLFGNIKKLLDSSLEAKIAKKAFQFVIQDIDANYSLRYTVSYTVFFPPLYRQVVFNLKSLHDQTGGDSADCGDEISKIEHEFIELVCRLETQRINIVKAHLIYPYYLIYENHYDRLVKSLFNKKENFHTFKNSDEAISELKDHFESALAQIKSFLNEIPRIDELDSRYKLFEIDEILKILSLENVSLDMRIADLILELHELNGTEYLCQLLFVYISCDAVDKTVLTDFDQVSETFQLLTTIDEFFRAVLINDTQALKNLLQKTNPNILAIVRKTRNENRQTLLEMTMLNSQ